MLAEYRAISSNWVEILDNPPARHEYARSPAARL
jgi:hypothetical protein